MITAIKAFIAKYEIYAGIAICLAMFFFGWYMHGIFIAAAREAELNAEISQHIKAEKDANDKSAALETELANNRKQNTQTNENVKNEVKKPAYNCVVPSAGKLLIRQALTSVSSR